MKPPPGRLATLQCHSWTQSSTPGWGLVLKASCRQDTAPCGQSEHTGQSGEAGGAERSELPGMPVPQGAGWSQLDGAPEHASHVHTPLHLTHTHAHTHAYSYTRTPRCTHIHIYAHARTHTGTHAHIRTHGSMHTCVHVSTHTHMHTRVCTYTNTGTHTALHPLHIPFPNGPRHSGLPVSTPGDTISSDSHPGPTLCSGSHFSRPWDSTDLASVDSQDDLLSLSWSPRSPGQDHGPQMNPAQQGPA